MLTQVAKALLEVKYKVEKRINDKGWQMPPRSSRSFLPPWTLTTYVDDKGFLTEEGVRELLARDQLPPFVLNREDISNALVDGVVSEVLKKVDGALPTYNDAVKSNISNTIFSFLKKNSYVVDGYDGEKIKIFSKVDCKIDLTKELVDFLKKDNAFANFVTKERKENKNVNVDLLSKFLNEKVNELRFKKQMASKIKIAGENYEQELFHLMRWFLEIWAKKLTEIIELQKKGKTAEAVAVISSELYAYVQNLLLNSFRDSLKNIINLVWAVKQTTDKLSKQYTWIELSIGIFRYVGAHNLLSNSSVISSFIPLMETFQQALGNVIKNSKKDLNRKDEEDGEKEFLAVLSKWLEGFLKLEDNIASPISLVKRFVKYKFGLVPFTIFKVNFVIAELSRITQYFIPRTLSLPSLDENKQSGVASLLLDVFRLLNVIFHQELNGPDSAFEQQGYSLSEVHKTIEEAKRLFSNKCKLFLVSSKPKKNQLKIFAGSYVIIKGSSQQPYARIIFVTPEAVKIDCECDEGRSDLTDCLLAGEMFNGIKQECKRRGYDYNSIEDKEKNSQSPNCDCFLSALSSEQCALLEKNIELYGGVPQRKKNTVDEKIRKLSYADLFLGKQGVFLQKLGKCFPELLFKQRWQGVATKNKLTENCKKLVSLAHIYDSWSNQEKLNKVPKGERDKTFSEKIAAVFCEGITNNDDKKIITQTLDGVLLQEKIRQVSKIFNHLSGIGNVQVGQSIELNDLIDKYGKEVRDILAVKELPQFICKILSVFGISLLTYAINASNEIKDIVKRINKAKKHKNKEQQLTIFNQITTELREKTIGIVQGLKEGNIEGSSEQLLLTLIALRIAANAMVKWGEELGVFYDDGEIGLVVLPTINNLLPCLREEKKIEVLLLEPMVSEIKLAEELSSDKRDRFLEIKKKFERMKSEIKKKEDEKQFSWLADIGTRRNNQIKEMEEKIKKNLTENKKTNEENLIQENSDKLDKLEEKESINIKESKKEEIEIIEKINTDEIKSKEIIVDNGDEKKNEKMDGVEEDKKKQLEIVKQKNETSISTNDSDDSESKNNKIETTEELKEVKNEIEQDEKDDVGNDGEAGKINDNKLNVEENEPKKGFFELLFMNVFNFDFGKIFAFDIFSNNNPSNSNIEITEILKNKNTDNEKNEKIEEQLNVEVVEKQLLEQTSEISEIKTNININVPDDVNNNGDVSINNPNETNETKKAEEEEEEEEEEEDLNYEKMMRPSWENAAKEITVENKNNSSEKNKHRSEVDKTIVASNENKTKKKMEKAYDLYSLDKLKQQRDLLKTQLKFVLLSGGNKKQKHDLFLKMFALFFKKLGNNDHMRNANLVKIGIAIRGLPQLTPGSILAKIKFQEEQEQQQKTLKENINVLKESLGYLITAMHDALHFHLSIQLLAKMFEIFYSSLRSSLVISTIAIPRLTYSVAHLFFPPGGNTGDDDESKTYTLPPITSTYRQ